MNPNPDPREPERLLPAACGTFRDARLAGGAADTDLPGDHAARCAACRAFADGPEVRTAAAVVRRLRRLPELPLDAAPSAMPDSFEEVFGASAASIQTTLAGSLAPQPAPSGLDARVEAALSRPLVSGPRPGSERSRPRRRLAPRLASVALAAALLVTSYLLGVFQAGPDPDVVRPRLRFVISDVARPHDWTLDPAAAGLYVAGVFDGVGERGGGRDR